MHPEETLENYERRINLHDFDQLVPLISDDAVFWLNDGSHVGLADIRVAFERTWQKFPLESYWLEDLNWIATAQGCAGCTYHFRWTATVKRKAISGCGRGTTILRQDTGIWKIAHKHLSQFPPL
jgi:ketosteroid isomerase-like protein